MLKQIGFIGAGKAGCGLASYFSEKGCSLTGIYSRTFSSAESLSQKLGIKPFSCLKDLVNESSTIFLSVPDGEIVNVWNQLKQFSLTGKIVCHISGSQSSDVFCDAEKYGVYAFSLHPMYAFSGLSTQGLDKASFTAEGNGEKMTELKSFIESLGNPFYTIETSKKALYHAANVAASNLVLALLNMSCEMLSLCGFEDNSLDALAPLITNNLNNIIKNGFEKSLTGPVERLDTGTICSHLEVLPPECSKIYKELSLKLIKIAESKNPGRDYHQLKNLLER